MTPVDELSEIMDKAVDALANGLVAGNPEPFKALWSHDPDVTVLGGFGGYALGWDEVSKNADFAASRFHGARSFGVKKLAHSASGDLGYAVWIEHGEVRVEGSARGAAIVPRPQRSTPPPPFPPSSGWGGGACWPSAPAAAWASTPRPATSSPPPSSTTPPRAGSAVSSARVWSRTGAGRSR